MAKAFEFGVGDLVAELLAHTLGVLGHFSPAGAISSPLFESFFDDIHHFFIGIQGDFHFLFLT